MTGGAGNDVMSGGDGNDTISGGADSDTIWGNNGNDIINGDAGIDLLYGNDGVDTMRGGADTHSDTLLGGDGDDIIYGEGVIDVLWGQGGNDTFTFEFANAFSTRDVIKDFGDDALGNDLDVIDISDVLDGSGYVDGTSVLSDFVSVTTDENHSYISVDQDGAGTQHSMAQIVYLDGYNTLDTNVDNLKTAGTLLVA